MEDSSVVTPLDNQEIRSYVGNDKLQKRLGSNLFLTVIFVLLITASFFFLTLKYYPSIYESLGLLSNKTEENQVKEGSNDVDREVMEKKWVEYSNLKLGISFKLPAEYIVEEYNSPRGENNPEVYTVAVKGLLSDSKGNKPSVVESFLEFYLDGSIKYSYDESEYEFEEGDLRSITVGDKVYPTKKYALGEGNPSGSFFISDLMIDVDSKLYIHMLNRSIMSYVDCSGGGECVGIDSSFSTTDKQIEDAIEILKTVKFIN